MKRKFLISFFVSILINTLLITDISMAQWVKTNITINDNVNALASFNGSIFAGFQYNGIHRTTNNGITWLSTGITGAGIYCFGTKDNSIFAGATSNIYLSTNGGINWSGLFSSGSSIHGLTFIGNTIFAGSVPYGVYKSTNNGLNWVLTSLDKGTSALATNGNSIFAGMVVPTYNDGGVFRSTNNGLNWIQVGLQNNSVSSFYINGSKIFASIDGPKIYLSNNNGDTWSNVSSGLGGYVRSISGINNFLIAGTWIGGVYISTNNGLSWTQKNEGFNTGTIDIKSTLIINNYIYVGNKDSYGGSVWRRPLSDFVNIQTISSEIPSKYYLSQNYPNPFNPTTNFKFSIPKASFVNITVFDITGKEIEVLINETLQAGTYKADWNGTNFSSGIYFYKISAGDFSEIKKMTYLK